MQGTSIHITMSFDPDACSLHMHAQRSTVMVAADGKEYATHNFPTDAEALWQHATYSQASRFAAEAVEQWWARRYEPWSL